MIIRANQTQFLAVLCLLALLPGCTQHSDELSAKDTQANYSQVSEEPPPATQTAMTTAHQSRLSTRARIAYADLETLIQEEFPAEHKDVGKKKVCKKIIGLKACGNAKWDYTVQRTGDIAINGTDDMLMISVPMKFFGVAGIGGDVSKLLKLDKLNFSGALNTDLQLSFDLDDNWCPEIKTDVSYDWTTQPRLKWKGGLDLDLKDELDKTIAKQVGQLQKQLTDTIDCENFRTTIQENWRQHSIPLALANQEEMYLNIEPNGFAFSGMYAEADKFGIAFMLDAKTSVQTAPLESTQLELPILNRTDYEAGETEFNVLIRVDYEQLQTLAAQELVGNTYTESSPAGDVSVSIDDVAFSGNPDGITINLNFQAQLPGKKNQTKGSIFLTASPVLDAFNQTVYLQNITLSNVLDNLMWNAIASVFNNRIIESVESKAKYELGPKLDELAGTLEQQLADENRTAGLAIINPEVNVTLESLVPEQTNLAALVRVSTSLDIEVPVTSLYEKHAPTQQPTTR